LAPYKRVDVIVKAATLHGVRTVIAGDGPERPKLEALAGNNVEFLGSVSEAEAGRLLDTCSAFVFCAEEDFGIAPIEANAHCAPVVALRAGGVAETIKDGETGVLFDQPTLESFSRAVEKALTMSWDERLLKANAERFSPGEFRQGIRRVVDDALRGVNW
jgi:glycosyltransferase involved in cell wall biosynthesis